MLDLGSLAGTSTIDPSVANGVSLDGTYVVGWTHVAASGADFRHTAGFIWTQAEGMKSLGSLSEAHCFADRSAANAVSRDGTVAVGKVRTAQGQWHAGRWVAGVGWSDLGVLGGSLSEAAGVSANGKVVVGWSSQESSSNFHAFRWTPERGMEDLNLVYAPLLQGIELETATAVSPDGRFIVGARASYPAIDFRLTCWTPARRRMWKCRAVWNWMEWICRRPCLANRHSGTSPAQAEHAGTAVCRHAGKRRYVHPDHPAERNMGHIGDGAALSATYYQQGARLW